MTRTWTLMIGLAVLMGSVCTGQDGYIAMAPAGLNIAGLNPLGSIGGPTMTPFSGDGTSLSQTLEGVQGNLAVFEASSGETGLPMNLCPYWINLPDFGTIQSGMGLQQPGQTITSIDLAGALPNSMGQIGSLTLPTSGLSIGSFDSLQITGFTGLLGNP